MNKLIEEKQLKRTVFPPEEFIFHAFNCCSLNDVKVVIIGQGTTAKWLSFADILRSLPRPRTSDGTFFLSTARSWYESSAYIVLTLSGTAFLAEHLQRVDERYYGICGPSTW